MHKDVNAWRIAMRVFFVMVFCFPSLVLAEGEGPKDLMPGVYSDPGISASKGYLGGQQQAQVDPFTGMLSIAVTDLSIPGDGGMDITLTRTYHSLSAGEYPEDSWIGTGWSMHYGQLRAQDQSKVCNPYFDGTVLDNPVFVTPDGVSHRLALADPTFTLNTLNSPTETVIEIGTAYVSDDYGMLFCEPDGSMHYKTTSGLRYDFGNVVSTPDGPMKHAWHVSRVSDLSGNYIDVEYTNSGAYGGYGKLISRIIASDGREVVFTYLEANTNSARLESIEYEGRLWRYEFHDGNIEFDAIEDKTYFSRGNFLIGVTDPEGLTWTYEYWPFNQSGDDGAGSIKKVINPHGGGGEYVYEKRVVPYLSVGSEQISVIEYRKIRVDAGSIRAFEQDENGHWVYAGLHSTDDTWYYSYSSDTSGDVTTILGPYEDRIYRHYGMAEAANGSVWRVGTLKAIDVFDAGQSSGGSPIRTEVYTWGGHRLSRENNQRAGRTIFDTEYRVPRLLQKDIIQDGVTYTTKYEAFTSVDAPFPPLPQRMLEFTDGALSDGSREVYKSYFFDFNSWVMGLPSGEETSDGRWYTREYNGKGQLIQEISKGRITNYSYDDQGNLSSEKVGDQEALRYSNYELGVAQSIVLPNGGTRSRTLDDFGRIISETDANQKTTTYAYDDIGRTTRVTPPIGHPTNIFWFENSARITRGTYEKEVRFDGFGNTTETVISATDALPIRVLRTFDLDGRLVRQGLVGSDGQSSYAEYSYDTLGRLTGTQHPGGVTSISRHAGRTTVTNELGHDHVTISKAFGDPSSAFPVQIQVPDMAPIVIEIDDNGQTTKVSQDWLDRTYEYNNNMTLSRYIEPESAIRIYSYDATGRGLLETEFTQRLNDKDTSNAAFMKHFEYDEMDRITEVRYTKDAIYFYNPLVADGFDRKTWKKSFSYGLEGSLQESIYDTDVGMYLKSGISEDYFMMSSTKNLVKRNYQYDDAYRMISESLSVDGRQFSLGYEYNNLGVIEALTYPDGERVAMTSNGLGLTTSVLPYAESIDYHLNGAPKRIDYGNNTLYSSTLNNRLMLESVAGEGIDDTLGFNYQYDAVGNIDQITEAHSGVLKTFSYDRANRLSSAEGPWGSESLTYDTLGNIATRTVNGVARTYNYDSRNALTSISGGISRTYQFDEWGAVTKLNDYTLDRGAEEEVVSYRYSPLIVVGDPVSITHMAYDADGLRVSLKGDGRKYFMYGSNGKLMHMLDEAAETYANYIYLGQKIIAKAKTLITCDDDYDGDGITHCKEKNWMLDPFDGSDAAEDSDGDGLSNLTESNMGLDPTRPDSDGDGMTDGFEVQYGFDPSNRSDGAHDADADGYSNRQEFDNGTDPLQPDPPPPVTDVLATAGSRVVVLQWKSPSQAGSYRVYVGTQPITETESAPYVVVQGRGYAHHDVENGIQYFFRIRAENSYGLSELSSEVTSTPGEQVWGNFSKLGSLEGSFNSFGEVSVLKAVYPDELTSRTVSSVTQGNALKFGTTSSQYSGESNLRTLEHGGRHIYRESASGHKVAIWENIDNVKYIRGAYYRPEVGAWVPFSIYGAGTTLLQSVDINTYGDVAIGMANYQYVYVSGTGYAQYKPMVAKLSHLTGALSSSDADRSNSSPELFGSLRERVEVSIDDAGVISTVWRTKNGFIWYNESTSGSFLSDAIELTDLSGVTTVKRLNNGDVLVSAGAKYKLRIDGVWQETVLTDETCPCYMDWAEDGSVVRVRTDVRRAKGKDYPAMVATIGQVVNGVIQWTNAIKDSDHATPLSVAAASYGNRFYVFWQDSAVGSAGSKYSFWDGQAWSTVEGPDNGKKNIVAVSEQVQIDAAGNFATSSGVYLNVDASYYPVVAPSGTYITLREGGGTVGEAGAIWTLPNNAVSFDLEDGQVLERVYLQTDGPQVQLEEVSGAMQFTFPEVLADTEFGFELTVTDSDGLVSTRAFTVLLLDAGNPPVISAGSDAVVDEGIVYAIDASVAIEDGGYSSSWRVVSGPKGVSPPIPSSTELWIPLIDGSDTPLQLEMWVRDHSTGRVATDIVTLTIRNSDGSLPPITDNTPPIVSASHQTRKQKGRTYQTLSLSANETATIYVRIVSGYSLTGSGTPPIASQDEPGWLEYQGSFELFLESKNGGLVEYWARDTAGNASPITQYGF